VGDRYPKLDMARDTIDDLNRIARAAGYSLIVSEPAQVKEQLDLMTKARKDIADRLPVLEKQLNTEKGKELFKKISDARTPYVNATTHFMKLVEEGKKDEAKKALTTEILPAQRLYFTQLEEFSKFLEDLMKQADKEADEVYAMARIIMLALAAIAAVIAALVAVFATRSITRPLNEAVQIAETVASGDLTSRIEVRSSDETGQLMQALKHMHDSLINIVSQVRTGTDTIATASAQIAAGTQDLSSRTEEQASSLEETASSMEELTSTVRQNADNARQANQLAVTASEVATKGGEVVSQVVKTMNDIDGSSKKMADIINVIDGIAFQTNILALNAAVEAARAGEQGRGFAVVATEVRSLAQRSASAAREIKTLIDDSVTKVESGSKLVADAGSTMEEVVSSIKRVNDIMNEITAASREQSDGIEQVNQAVIQMDQVTQQNAALVEEAAAAAESLQDQAANLVQVVSVFRTGQSAAAVPAVRKLVTTTKPALKVVSKPAAPARVAQIPAKVDGGKGEDWEEF
ncbi:MAG: methyl-accepting chemotaxis protein, partial [Burkholderiaceae bacterium]|nr:methyl-accepting chemotaxis protein [Burkholderiaceae bacterium]